MSIIRARCHVEPLTLTAHGAAVVWTRDRKFAFCDALIVASARKPGRLFTEDTQHGRAIDQELTIVNASRRKSALRTAAEEAVDHPAAAGADVGAAVGRELVQHGARRDQDPLAVDQRAPLTVFGKVGARGAAIAFDAVHGAVAAGVARAGLLQLLVPVVALGMTLAMVPVLREG